MTVKKQCSTKQIRFKGNPDDYTPTPAGAAPVLNRSASVGENGSDCGATLTCTFSPAPTSGRLLIAVVYDGTGVTPTPPTGGASWIEFSAGTARRMWYKIANGSEPTNYNITYYGVAKADATQFSMFEFTGNFSTPLDANSTAVDSTNPNPAITTLHAYELAFAVMVNSETTALTAPSGWTLARSDVTNGSGGSAAHCNISACYKTMNTTGSTGTASWTFSLGSPLKAYTLGIRSQ